MPQLTMAEGIAKSIIDSKLSPGLWKTNPNMATARATEGKNSTRLKLEDTIFRKVLIGLFR